MTRVHLALLFVVLICLQPYASLAQSSNDDCTWQNPSDCGLRGDLKEQGREAAAGDRAAQQEQGLGVAAAGATLTVIGFLAEKGALVGAGVVSFVLGSTEMATADTGYEQALNRAKEITRTPQYRNLENAFSKYVGHPDHIVGASEIAGSMLLSNDKELAWETKFVDAKDPQGDGKKKAIAEMYKVVLKYKNTISSNRPSEKYASNIRLTDRIQKATLTSYLTNSNPPAQYSVAH